MDISSIINNNAPAVQDENATTSNPDHPALLEAINSANIDRIRTILREICTASPQAFQLACDKLLINHAKSSSNSSAKKKRDPPQLRYEICQQCEEEYDVLDNVEDACTWHPDELELDEEGEFWADYGEVGHEDFDTEEWRKECPGGFVYACCQGDGNAKGCEVGEHVPDLCKRAKIWG